MSFGSGVPVFTVWFVRLMVFITIMFAVSLPLGLILRAV
jgi:hypothetical protein